MSVPVLTAVTGARWETDLVSALEHSPIPLSVVRRCVDLPDLLAAANSGQARAVVLSADLRRLDRDAVTRLKATGVAVIGVVTPGDLPATERLNHLGVHQVVPADATPEMLAAAVETALEDPQTGAADPRQMFADPFADIPPMSARDGLPGLGDASVGTGRLVAVWGPTGAPGRTTLAVNLATELAEFHVRTLLADADVYGGVVAQALGLLEEAPGLAAACRSANNGVLDQVALTRHTRQLSPDLLVLTGLVRADRWTELRASALEIVWSAVRTLAAVTVVDLGFCLEADEEITFDTAAPRRNGATLVTLEQADTVVAVGSADPIGLQRLVRGLAQLHDTLPDVKPVVVVNGVRRAPVGGSPDKQIRTALLRHAGVDNPVLIPYDRAALDSSLAQGRALAEVAPNSLTRKAIRDLAAEVGGVASRATGDRSRGGGRRKADARARQGDRGRAAS
jgi:Flp pilus assembly CpaE family ATPase